MKLWKRRSFFALAWILVADGVSNHAFAQKVYWAQSFSDRIQRANVNGSAAQVLIEPPLAFDPIAVKVNVANDKLYWAETFDDTIRSANLDGSSMQTILQPPAVFDAVAIDLDEFGSPPRVYWVRGIDDVILRANLDGTGVETIVQPPNSFDVTAIAVDPSRNVIYWAENPGDRIRRANLDGSNVQTFLDVIFVSDPVALAVDEVCGHLYWAERAGDRIRRSSFDGLTVETVLDAVFVSDPVALAFTPGASGCDGTVYWAEGTTDRIRGSSNSGGPATTIVQAPTLFDPVSLDVDPRQPPPVPPPPLVVWDPADLASTRSTRSLTLSLTAPPPASAGAGTAALQIKMVDLQHPVPRNRPQYSPPSFTAFDTRLNGVCSGAAAAPNFNGHHCDTGLDCVGPDISITTDDGTCGSLLACTAAGEANGCVRWVGPVATFREKQDVLSLGTYKAARLQCRPYYTDWTTVGSFSVFGAELLPSSTFEVRTFASDCKGIESTCTNLSPVVTMKTRRWADVAAPFNPGTLPETDQPDGSDVVAVLNKFKGLVGSPSNATVLLQPNAIDPNADVSGSDIVATVDAFKGLAYPFSGPCICPSTVICGALACPPGDCGMGVCVKTCVGGSNAGLPCGDDLHAHCPGGTCSATGYCRDRCGRCN